MRQLTRRLKPALLGIVPLPHRFSHTMPMLIQNSVANFIILLNNIMVGQLGTAQMSGVAVAGQLLVIVNLCIFGGLSGHRYTARSSMAPATWKACSTPSASRLWVVGAGVCCRAGCARYGEPI